MAAETPDRDADPAVTGVPPETPDDVRPSATGLVAGPIDGETDVEVAPVDAGATAAAGSDVDGPETLDQRLEDAEGGVEASTLDAPDS